MMVYLGIDQHARQFTVSLRAENGDVLEAWRSHRPAHRRTGNSDMDPRTPRPALAMIWNGQT
jgi:hypothetical protein